VAALAVVLAAAAVAIAPSSLADSTGAIAGTVTEAAAPHGPIAGIQVCAFNRSERAVSEESSEQPPCATTGAEGGYTIDGLASGQYTVGFWEPLNSQLNYVSQYYDDKANGEASDAVTVSAPATTTGIDAQLAVGGRIAGTVTDANSGAGLENVLICAERDESEGNCGFSGVGGAYTVSGLASGGYTVLFFHRGYQIQVYDGKASPAEADLVAVAQGATTTGIDSALKPSSSPVAAPLGSPSPGRAPGPSTAALPGAMPFATVVSRRLVLKRHSVYVKVRCAHARCVGSISLGQPSSGRRPPLTTGVALARFSIAAGRERTVALRLPGKRRSMFARARSHPVSLRLALRLEGGNRLEESVLVS
jgi:hypothetical protein